MEYQLASFVSEPRTPPSEEGSRETPLPPVTLKTASCSDLTMQPRLMFITRDGSCLRTGAPLQQVKAQKPPWRQDARLQRHSSSHQEPHTACTALHGAQAAGQHSIAVGIPRTRTKQQPCVLWHRQVSTDMCQQDAARGTAQSTRHYYNSQCVPLHTECIGVVHSKCCSHTVVESNDVMFVSASAADCVAEARAIERLCAP